MATIDAGAEARGHLVEDVLVEVRCAAIEEEPRQCDSQGRDFSLSKHPPTHHCLEPHHDYSCGAIPQLGSGRLMGNIGT